MELQVLNALPSESQPRLDVRVLGVSSSGILIPLLNFAGTCLIDFRQHWLKRNAKNRALRSAPAALVGQRFGKLQKFSGKFHLEDRSIVEQPLRLPTVAKAGDAPALQFRHHFAKKCRPAINESCVKLNKLRARLKSFPSAFCIEDSTRSDYGNFGAYDNAAHKCSRFFP